MEGGRVADVLQDDLHIVTLRVPGEQRQVADVRARVGFPVYADDRVGAWADADEVAAVRVHVE